MRLLLITCMLWLAGLAVRAQALPLDEQGKVSFYTVVKADSLRAGLLYAHAKNWLHRRGYALATADSAAGRLVATHALGVYDRGYLTKKLHGKVRYQCTVEVKNGRYRVQFTDFVFAYYQENHTYQFVPTGKTKPLEEPLAAGWQQLWQHHRQDTLAGITALQLELKTAMLAAPRPAAPALVPRSPEW